MRRAKVQVVNLADLGPDGVHVAGFVGDFAGLGMDARFIEALQRPEEVVGSLQTDRFSRVGHHGEPRIGSTAGEAEALGEIVFGVFESGAQGRVAVFVTAFGDPVSGLAVETWGWGSAGWVYVMVLRATRNPGLAEAQEGSSPSRAAVRQRKAW